MENVLRAPAAATAQGPRKCDQQDSSITSEHTREQTANQDEFPLGDVYFLELPTLGRIKIGSTCSLTNRLRSLSFVLPEPPRLLGAIRGGASEEMRWHARWAALRVHREWFTATPELRAAIAAAIAAEGWTHWPTSKGAEAQS
jgi:hypothetical protein